MKDIVELLYDITLLIIDTFTEFVEELFILLDASFLAKIKLYRRLTGGVWELYTFDKSFSDIDESVVIWLKRRSEDDKIEAIDMDTQEEVPLIKLTTEDYNKINKLEKMFKL